MKYGECVIKKNLRAGDWWKEKSKSEAAAEVSCCCSCSRCTTSIDTVTLRLIHVLSFPGVLCRLCRPTGRASLVGLQAILRDHGAGRQPQPEGSTVARLDSVDDAEKVE